MSYDNKWFTKGKLQVPTVDASTDTTIASLGLYNTSMLTVQLCSASHTSFVDSFIIVYASFTLVFLSSHSRSHSMFCNNPERTK